MNTATELAMNDSAPGAPDGFPRRILLAVTGLSPQIVTETLYALAVARSPAFVPTEIHLITTVEGAERARLALLSDEPGWFHRLRRDYRLPEMRFDAGCLHVLEDAAGDPLADIRSPADNERAADIITEMVRALTADPASSLHVSIAGGRKTMGFYLGYALSLFGRSQDRLSHVLVNEPFESSWDFFYPTPYSRVITTRDNKLADTAAAEVTLAEIPFVSMRHGLPQALLAGRARFHETVAAANDTLGPPELVIDLDNRRVRVGGALCSLPPAELAFLSWFARRCAKGEPALPGLGEKDPGNMGERYKAEYMSEYQAIDPLGDEGRVADRLRHGMLRQFFDERKSKLHKALRRALRSAAEAYFIHGEARRPRRYRLTLPPEAIRFAAIEEPSGPLSPPGKGSGRAEGPTL